jgi:hypothetical protein
MSIRSPDIAIMSLASDQMLLPQTDRITSRRRFFQYLAASPLITHIGAPAFAPST